MKHDWKRHEKRFYLPKIDPEIIHVPGFKFFSIKGEGNPNDDFFADYIQTLYSLSYAIKMSPKQGFAPKDYFEYSVYPLEGMWDLKDKAKNKALDTFDKSDLVFNLMIRQPDFVQVDFANEIINRTMRKKPNRLFESVAFETIEDGPSIQMLHIGSYDDESISFKRMEDFALSQGLKRATKIHREIYLSDARKVAKDKLRTVLRFRAE
jgi:hypothetical protein